MDMVVKVYLASPSGARKKVATEPLRTRFAGTGRILSAAHSSARDPLSRALEPPWKSVCSLATPTPR